MSTPTGILSITTSGIQDVSGFLPLLGTEQCEIHVSCALERGFFYAAGSPMSIFGSLGIVKAGFTALWISLDRSPFHGPRQLRNAGFNPKGVTDMLSYALDVDNSIYTAEHKMRTILRRHDMLGVYVDLLNWPWLKWNLLLLCLTIGFGSLGFLPYVYLIHHDLSDRPFLQSWLYPGLRVFGSVTITVMIQFIVQLRILVIVHSRLRFHAVNAWFKEEGKVPPVHWNAEMRSEECIVKLVDDFKCTLDLTRDKEKNATGCPRYIEGLQGTGLASKSFSSFSRLQTKDDQKPENLKEQPVWILIHLCRVLMFLGIVSAIAGYVGCFGLVQASNSATDNGPAIWLAGELVLCVVRLIVWASNPGFDDPPPPIAIHKSRPNTGAESRAPTPSTDRSAVTYEIGWMLDDVIVEDLRAVIVGIDKYERGKSMSLMKGAVRDASSVSRYLQDDLGVPESQIKYMTNDEATTLNINKALKRLATDTSIQPGAPIIIYFACYLARDTTSSLPVLTTYDYQPSTKKGGIPYSDFLHMIQTISASKGNYITVILDTCFSGHAQRNEKIMTQVHPVPRPASDQKTPTHEDSQLFVEGNADITRQTISDFRVGHPTHVLLGACSTDEFAREGKNGGIFTAALLQELRGPEHRTSEKDGDQYSVGNIPKRITWMDYMGFRGSASQDVPATQQEDSDIQKMTYCGLIRNIHRNIGPTIGTCSGNFQNRLLFSGLLASRRQSTKASSVISISNEKLVSTRGP